MAFLGATRIFGLYRFANMMALADAKVRGVGPDKAIGARGWDSYSWHTDLPPGHPMVTGAQTNDFDLFTVENSKLVLVWGMNWITTKMPDSHWSPRPGSGHQGDEPSSTPTATKATRCCHPPGPTRRSRWDCAGYFSKLFDQGCENNTDLRFSYVGHLQPASRKSGDRELGDHVFLKKARRPGWRRAPVRPERCGPSPYVIVNKRKSFTVIAMNSAERWRENIA